MHAVDTNILVRLVARDNAEQLASAERFVREGAWVPMLALAESVRVLEAVYHLTPGQSATAVEMLLNHRQLIVQEPDVVAAALQVFRSKPGLGFSDCLLLEMARKEGYTLGTFDRRLGRMDGAQRL